MNRKRPQNIVISHVYSSANKGDAALTSVLINDLKRRFPKAQLTILKLEGPCATFEGVPEQPSFMYLALNGFKNPLLKLAFVMYMIPATFLWAACARLTGMRLYLPKKIRAVADVYANADLIVGVGGGYIRSRPGLANRINIPLLLHPLLFAHILKKPTALYAQSVGPFTARYEERLVAFVLKRMLLILLREDISVELLTRLGVTHNIARAIDSGFLLEAREAVDLRQRYHIPPDTLVIGVTVRSWLSGDAQTAYEKAVAGALDKVVKKHKARVLFIPQVTAAKGDDDRVASRRVHGYMQYPNAATVIADEPDHHQIKAIYNGIDVLLGTRFHSVIFSLTSFVPVVAIEYEHKTSGIMRDLNLSEWVIHIQDVTAANLTELMHKLVAEQAQYRRHLRAQMPPYVRRARQTVELLADRLQATQ